MQVCQVLQHDLVVLEVDDAQSRTLRQHLETLATLAVTEGYDANVFKTLTVGEL